MGFVLTRKELEEILQSSGMYPERNNDAIQMIMPFLQGYNQRISSIGTAAISIKSYLSKDLLNAMDFLGVPKNRQQEALDRIVGIIARKNS